jgi:hypothetical protein
MANRLYSVTRGLEKRAYAQFLITGLRKISFAVITLSLGSLLHAGRSIHVINHQGDMQKFGYIVQACETGNPDHCGAMRTVRTAQPDRETVAGKQDVSARIVVKKQKDGDGKKMRMKPSYDVSFYVGGEKVVWIEGVKPNTKMECWDGGAFYFDAKTGEEKEVAWPSIASQRAQVRGSGKAKTQANGRGNHKTKK